MNIYAEYSLEGLMLKLKFQYFGHLMQRADSLEKTLIWRKVEGRKRRQWQRMRWLDGITDSTDMTLSKLQKITKDKEAWYAGVHHATNSWMWQRLNNKNMRELTKNMIWALTRLAKCEFIYLYMIAQLVKNLAAIQENSVLFLVGKFCWRRDRLPTPIFLGFPCGSVGKEYACNVGDRCSTPRLGRSPRGGKGYIPVFWPGEFLYSPLGCEQPDTTERLSLSHIYT